MQRLFAVFDYLRTKPIQYYQQQLLHGDPRLSFQCYSSADFLFPFDLRRAL